MPPEMPRRFCCDHELELIGYDGRHAAADLEEWRARGPHPVVQELLDVLVAAGVEGATVLDIGAGVGVVHLSLLEAGAARAIDVDASKEYLAVARDEAARRGVADRVEHHHGDAVELAGRLPPADIATLVAVICCYPYLAPLLRAAVAPGPRLVGLVYPVDAWWSRLAMHLDNLVSAVLGRMDRWFVHRRAEIDRLMVESGFRQHHRGGTRFWRVVVYRRA